MGAPSLDLPNGHSDLARGQLFAGPVAGLGRMRIVARRLRPQLSYRPYDQTPFAHDRRAGVDPSGRAHTGFMDWNAGVRPACLSSCAAAIPSAPVCTIDDKTFVLLDVFRDDSSRLAPAGIVCARYALRGLAYGRTTIVLLRRHPVLVACDPALAKPVD